MLNKSMKKVRLAPKKGSVWSFKLYDSAEAAYYMKEDERDRSEYHQRIGLPEGSYMEVEWMGAEYIYDEDVETIDSWYESFDKVRLARVTRGSGSKDSLILATGWVAGDTIPWSRKVHEAIRISKINGKIKSKLDFSELFKELWRDDPDTLPNDGEPTSSN